MDVGEGLGREAECRKCSIPSLKFLNRAMQVRVLWLTMFDYSFDPRGFFIAER
jgi:hypothetical protein